MSGLAPPGSSEYNGPAMYVGDGTWDSTRNTFLLPNLVGLNFATMRYNGMGNRFFTMNGYHSLVRAHGVIAAITFLGAVPAAIFLMRFYGRNPPLALRLHIWLQVLTLLLSTVAFILGFMAVGPQRSLSNPHHGIGVAIYVLIWVQVIGGCLIHRKKRKYLYIPLKAMLHHWLGRAIALLGIVQVALGLTLYGSPLFLFVLYTLYVFALVVLYFILQWLHERRKARYGSDGSYYTDEVVSGPNEQKHSGFGKIAAAGAAGVGLAALFRRRSSKNQSSHVTGTESGTSYSYYTDEKASSTSNKGLFGKLMQVAAVGAAVVAVKKLFGRKDNRRDDDSDLDSYRPPLGGNQSITTDSMSRIEEGRPPVRPITPTGNSPHGRPSHPLAQPPLTPGGSGRRNSGSSYSYESYMSGSPSRHGRKTHTFRDALAAGGAMYAVRSIFKNRRQRKEDHRSEVLRKQRIEQERISRMNSVHRYTGDGVTPPRRARHNRMGSQTASDISSALDQATVPTGVSGTVPIVGAGVGAAAASALADRNRIRPVGEDPVISTPGPNTAGLSDMPPVPPPHGGEIGSSGSEVFTTASGRTRHRHRDQAAAGLAGAALGAMAAGAVQRRHDSQNTDSMESPPVSLHIKRHGSDGRQVTLRRLTEEEAAAQREERRKQRQASAAARRRRNSSFSSSDGGELATAGPSAADRRWRRTEALEAEQEAQNNAAAAAAAATAATYPPPVTQSSQPSYAASPPPGMTRVDPSTGQTYQVPLPPPIPASVSNLGPAGSITSPGTETSGATEYANNRRRRRAERAQARLAREGRSQNTVDFT